MADETAIRALGQRSLTEIEQRLREIEVEKIALDAHRRAWQVILNTPLHVLEEVVVKMVEVKTETTPPIEVSPEAINFTAMARKIIDETDGRGFVPKDVTRELEARGAKPSDGFVSNLLHRMKTKGELAARSGRYYLPKFDPTPSLVLTFTGGAESHSGA